MMKRVLCKWCDKMWLIATYGIGLLMMIWAAVGWSGWETPRKLLCLLAILLPLHVLEENTFPDGFHYMMNLIQHSDDPNAGPMNRLSDMVSNFGGEVLFVVLFLWGGNVGSSILVAFFGIGESVVHTIFGILTHQKLKERGMKTIYGPGLATSYLTLLPLSAYAIRSLSTQTIVFADVLTGILLIICVIALLIRIPILVFGKYQPEYAFSSSGYFKKYERPLP
jgi:hypothetical protein